MFYPIPTQNGRGGNTLTENRPLLLFGSENGESGVSFVHPVGAWIFTNATDEGTPNSATTIAPPAPLVVTV